MTKGWSIKYYKGLGTSTAKEAKEYFRDLEKNRIDMRWGGDGSGDAIDMAFSKSRVADRTPVMFRRTASVNGSDACKLARCLSSSLDDIVRASSRALVALSEA